jgi:4'-phosphopantetheinyl transferase
MIGSITGFDTEADSRRPTLILSHDHLWDPSPMDFSLSKNDIHIWCASLNQQPSRFQRLAQTLSADERMRAERFYFEKDRRRFIVRRGLLRTILGCYLGIEPNRLRFCYGPYGKPALAETSGGIALRFNLAHSQGLALYAITHDREIGIDLERVRPISEVEQIAEKLFSTRENAKFRALSMSKKYEAFFKCWTSKEAYLKATGDGLSQPLVLIEVSIAPGEPARLLSIEGDPQKASRWSIQELIPASGYVAALVVEGEGWCLESRQLKEQSVRNIRFNKSPQR